ncbi:MAG: hypothetical protein ACOY16_10450 [Chloroflexota bacterium]
MDTSSQIPFILLQAFNLILIAAWLVLAVLSLSKLHKADIDVMAKALWITLILLIPLFGALVFLSLYKEKPRGK